MGLTNSQYEKLMNIYDERMYSANRQAAERKAAFYGKYPQAKALDDAVTDDYASMAKARAMDDKEAFAKAEEHLTRTLSKKSAFLSSHGVDENDFLPRFNCPDCRDTGYIGNKKCHCFIQASIDLIYAQSGILDLLEKENFNTFRLNLYPEDMIDPVTEKSARQNAKSARDFSLDFSENFLTIHRGENILFYGATGTGKTFLTHCIAKNLIDKGISVIYLSAVRLFEIMARDHFGHDSGDATGFVNNDLLECDLLIIDDLGTETVNNFTISALFELINERGLSGKSVIISANLDPRNMMETYSERIFSRLAKNYRMFKIYGHDLRLR